MSDKFITNEVATLLKTLSPDEAKALLSKLKTDAIEAAKIEREQKEAKRAKRADPKKQKKYFKQFDEEVGALPGAYIQIRAELSEATGWQPEDGDCQLHWRRKQPGSQCLWSCKWHTASGILEPESYMPLRLLKAVELIAEARDISHPPVSFVGVPRPNPEIVNKEIVPLLKLIEDGGIPDLDKLKKMIARCRGNYREYLAPWSIPSHSFQPLVRPSWGSLEEIKKEMERLRTMELPKR